ncbi:MAG TPA: methyltransferase domain-containing protein, partial [Candidatus Elarobacter sp.]
MSEPRPPGHQRFSLFHRSTEEEAARRAAHATFADVFRGAGSVLDLGCGPGVFLDLLRERGVSRRLGIERDPELAAEARERGHEVLAADLRTALPTLDERFEGIYCAFTIETFDGDDAIAVLARCAELLAPDGTLIVRTLNPANPAVRDGGLWLEPWVKRPYPLVTLHAIFSDLGLRIVGAGNEPGGWQHTYLLGRTAPAPQRASAVKIAFQGEFFAYNSMAVVNRELARALQAFPDVAPAIVPDEPLAEPSVANDPRYGALHAAIRRGVPACDVLIRQSNGAADFRRIDGVRKIVQILPWEYGVLPRSWVAGLHGGGADEVWVPSTYCRQLFLDAGFEPQRIAVVPNGIDPQLFDTERPVAPFPLPTQKPFRFLFVGGALPRKGIDVLLAAYRRAFTRADETTLVLKLFGTRSFYQLDAAFVAALRAFVA